MVRKPQFIAKHNPRQNNNSKGPQNNLLEQFGGTVEQSDSLGYRSGRNFGNLRGSPQSRNESEATVATTDEQPLATPNFSIEATEVNMMTSSTGAKRPMLRNIPSRTRAGTAPGERATQGDSDDSVMSPWRKRLRPVGQPNRNLVDSENSSSPSWKKELQSEEEIGIHTESLVKPELVLQKQQHPQVSPRMPEWQKTLLKKKEELATAGIATIEVSMETYRQRKGQPLEPIVPGIPGWKQRIVSSRNRQHKPQQDTVERKPDSPVKKEKATAEADAEWQKRLMSDKATRQVPPPVVAAQVANHDWAKRLSEGRETRERKRRASVSRRREPIAMLKEQVESIEITLPLPESAVVISLTDDIPEPLEITIAPPEISLVIEEKVEEMKIEPPKVERKSEAEIRKAIEEEEKMVKEVPKKQVLLSFLSFFYSQCSLLLQMIRCAFFLKTC